MKNKISNFNREMFINLSSVLSDPVDVVWDRSINAGVIWTGTPTSPGDNSDQSATRVEGATGVSLARVLSTFWESSADHALDDFLLWVSALALSIVDEWDGDVLKNGSKRSTLTGGSPSSDNEVSAALLVLGWEFGSLDILVVKERFGVIKEEKSNVVGEGPAVVVLVNNDSDDLSLLFI